MALPRINLELPYRGGMVVSNIPPMKTALGKTKIDESLMRCPFDPKMSGRKARSLTQVSLQPPFQIGRTPMEIHRMMSEDQRLQS